MSLERELGQIEARLGAMETELKGINSNFTKLNDEFHSFREDTKVVYQELEDTVETTVNRLNKFEKDHNRFIVKIMAVLGLMVAAAQAVMTWYRR